MFHQWLGTERMLHSSQGQGIKNERSVFSRTVSQALEIESFVPNPLAAIYVLKFWKIPRFLTNYAIILINDLAFYFSFVFMESTLTLEFSRNRELDTVFEGK